MFSGCLEPRVYRYNNAHAPFAFSIGILSGNYEDDFESSMTQDQIASMMDHGSGESVPNDASVEVDSEASLDKSDGIAVGFNEISALRESLASDSIIKKSVSL